MNDLVDKDGMVTPQLIKLFKQHKAGVITEGEFNESLNEFNDYLQGVQR